PPPPAPAPTSPPKPVIPVATATTRPAQPTPPPAVACCRRCTTGKACGNSCISASLNCHQPDGCACNAGIPTDDPPVSMTPEELEAEAVLLAQLNAELSPCDQDDGALALDYGDVP